MATKHLNLYLVERKIGDYCNDNYISFVCAAETTTKAKLMYPLNNRYYSLDTKLGSWVYNDAGILYRVEEDVWPPPSKLKAKKIGTTHIKKPKVIMHSFNAG